MTDGSSSFDQARLIRQNQILLANGIDPSGACPYHFYDDNPMLTLRRHAVGRQSRHPSLISHHFLLLVFFHGRLHSLFPYYSPSHPLFTVRWSLLVHLAVVRSRLPTHL